MQRHSVVTLAMTALLAAAGALSVPAAGGAQPAGHHTTIEVSNDGVSVVFMAHSAHNLLSLTVRIAGPDGALLFDERVEGPMLEWVPNGELVDGEIFQWEARAVTAIPGAQRLASSASYDSMSQAHTRTGFNAGNGNQDATRVPIEGQFAEADKHVERASGMLQVEDGLLTGPFSPALSVNWGERLLGRMMVQIVGVAKAADYPHDFVAIQDAENDSHTYISFGSDSVTKWRIEDYLGDLNFVELNSGYGFVGHRMTLEPGGNLGLGTTQPQDPIHIRHPGPVIRFNDSNNEQTWQLMATEFGYRIADQTAGTLPFYIQPAAPNDSLRISANGNIGLGTATPAASLHVADSSPRMILDNTAEATSWMLFGTQTGLGTYYNSGGSPPFYIFNGAPGASLSVSGGDGNVGVGTFSPDTPLHVTRSNGTAKVLVEETSAMAGPRELFELRNNGGPFFIFRNTDIGESYSFAMGATGHFLISHQQSPGVQFRLTPSGDAQFQGNVTANGVLLTSSRETKTDFAPIDAQALLAKLDGLDVSAWRYKREPATERHIGPMAEDFREVFGIGDGRHISAGDANGILFAAVKALKAKDDQLSEAVAEMGRLEARLVALEARVAAD